MSEKSILLKIAHDQTGRSTITGIYDDEMAGLLSQGSAITTRASHVEPTADGKWTADMAPSGGPILGPFDLRQQALDAEKNWLEAKLRKSL